MKTKTAISLFDIHAPYHDEFALSIALQAIEKIKPDEVNIGGDMLDMMAVKAWSPTHKEHNIRESVEDEIEIGVAILEAIRDAAGPKCSINYYEGNHEDRFTRYIYKNAIEMYPLLKLEKQLELSRLDIKWLPYGKKQLGRVLGTDLYIRHSPFSYGKHAAYANLDKKHISLLCGCTHRKQSITIKSGTGKLVRAILGGCLLDMNSDAFSYIDTDNWSQGFVITTLVNGQWYNEQVEIINGEAVVQGELITG